MQEVGNIVAASLFGQVEIGRFLHLAATQRLGLCRKGNDIIGDDWALLSSMRDVWDCERLLTGESNVLGVWGPVSRYFK